VVTLQFRGGLVGVVDVSWSTPISSERRLMRGNLDPFVVEGDCGTIELDPYQGDMMVITTEQGVERRPARPGVTPAQAYQASYISAQGHFVHCLRTGAPAENEAHDNLKTLAPVFAAYASVEQNRVIHLADDHGQ
jgi:predicted dehydrogenase